MKNEKMKYLRFNGRHFVMARQPERPPRRKLATNLRPKFNKTLERLLACLQGCGKWQGETGRGQGGLLMAS